MPRSVVFQNIYFFFNWSILLLELTLGKTVAPSLVLVIVGCRRTPRFLIEIQTVIHKSVFVEKWKRACSPSSISSISTQTTRSRALVAHERIIYHTFSVSCPVSTTAVTVHAVCDIIVCLTASPLLIPVEVTGRCTPRLLLSLALVYVKALCILLSIVYEREDARCMIVVPC